MNSPNLHDFSLTLPHCQCDLGFLNKSFTCFKPPLQATVLLFYASLSFHLLILKIRYSLILCSYTRDFRSQALYLNNISPGPITEHLAPTMPWNCFGSHSRRSSSPPFPPSRRYSSYDHPGFQGRVPISQRIFSKNSGLKSYYGHHGAPSVNYLMPDGQPYCHPPYYAQHHRSPYIDHACDIYGDDNLPIGPILPRPDRHKVKETFRSKDMKKDERVMGLGDGGNEDCVRQKGQKLWKAGAGGRGGGERSESRREHVGGSGVGHRSGMNTPSSHHPKPPSTSFSYKRTRNTTHDSDLVSDRGLGRCHSGGGGGGAGGGGAGGRNGRPRMHDGDY